jgi:hypothetical protein
VECEGDGREREPEGGGLGYKRKEMCANEEVWWWWWRRRRRRTSVLGDGGGGDGVVGEL